MNQEARLCTLCASHVRDRGIISCTKKLSVTDGSPVPASSRRMYSVHSCGTEGEEWTPVTTLDKSEIALLSDQTTSAWFRASLAAALARDPVDAANEAEVLAAVLAARTSRAFADQAGSNQVGVVRGSLDGFST